MNFFYGYFHLLWNIVLFLHSKYLYSVAEVCILNIQTTHSEVIGSKRGENCIVKKDVCVVKLLYNYKCPSVYPYVS